MRLVPPRRDDWRRPPYRADWYLLSLPNHTAPRGQSSETPEARGSKAGGHHPKTEVAAPTARIAPATVGAAHELSITPERAAAHYANA